MVGEDTELHCLDIFDFAMTESLATNQNYLIDKGNGYESSHSGG